MWADAVRLAVETQLDRRLIKDEFDFALAYTELGRGLSYRSPLIQDVFARELAVRVVLHIPVGLDAIAVGEPLRCGLAKYSIYVGARPDIERSLTPVFRIFRIDDAVG